jgi:hypothetical protein
VSIEPDREVVDLAFELAQPACETVALLAEGLRERHHRLHEPAVAVIGVQDVGHRRPPREKSRTASKTDAVPRGPGGADLARPRVAALTG